MIKHFFAVGRMDISKYCSEIIKVNKKKIRQHEIQCEHLFARSDRKPKQNYMLSKKISACNFPSDSLRNIKLA